MKSVLQMMEGVNWKMECEPKKPKAAKPEKAKREKPEKPEPELF